MTAFALASYPSRAALAEGLADHLTRRLSAVVALRDRASIAVPGGTTPGPMLARLGAAALPWKQIAVTLTDERQVPASSPRSNQRLLSQTLFLSGAACAHFVPLYNPLYSTEPDGLRTTCALLEHDLLPLDLAVLGMGADCHTASLFAGASELDHALASDAPAALAIAAPGSGELRVTLSARVLAAAGERHILIAGADKRAALDRALDLDDPRKAPVLAVLQNATVHYAD